MTLDEMLEQRKTLQASKYLYDFVVANQGRTVPSVKMIRAALEAAYAAGANDARLELISDRDKKEAVQIDHEQRIAALEKQISDLEHGHEYELYERRAGER